MNSIAKLLVRTLGLAGLLLAPLATRAQAVADLSVSLSSLSDAPILGRRDPNLGQIVPSQVKQYSIELDNLGPSTAVDVDVAKPVIDSRLRIVNVAGCALKSFLCGAQPGETSPQCTSEAGGERVIDPNDARSWPCLVPSVADFTAPTVDFDVEWPVPPDDPATEDVDESLPTTCPELITLTATSVSVTTTGTTDPDLANNTATHTPVAGAVADLTINLVSDVYAGGEGTQFTVTATVTNNGPCAAADVFVLDWDGLSDQKMTWIDTSTTGCLDNAVEPGFDGCEVGDMPNGGTATVTASYIVGSIAADELQRATTVSWNTYSLLFPYAASASGSWDGRTFDPKESGVTSHNVDAINVITSQDVSTCSTGGVPGLLGLLLVGFPLLRRRSR